MTDIFTKEKRSEVMSKIRGKRTKPEMFVHNILKGNRIRHKMWPYMHGYPDILIYPNTLVFVNGCFWHGCVRHFKYPKTNSKFWKEKIRRNYHRQREVIRYWQAKGYEVMVIWEHDLR